MFWTATRLARMLCWSGLLLLGLGSSAWSYEAELKKLAQDLVVQMEAAGQINGTVTDFTDLQGQPNELGRFLAQELSDQLITAGKTMSFLDRAGLQYLLRENKLSAEGLVDPETTRKLGNLIGIDTLIIGTATPLGESIRLSVRAIAVETAKIVGSQSTTLPPSRDLQALYTRGVAAAAPNGDIPGSSPAGRSVRDRLRADSFKLTPIELVVNVQGRGSKASFSIENLSGIGVGMALSSYGTSAGPCDLASVVNGASGLAMLSGADVGEVLDSDEPEKRLRWLPAGAKVVVTIDLDRHQCPGMVEGQTTVPLTANLIVAAGKDAVLLPLSVDAVQVRLIK